MAERLVASIAKIPLAESDKKSYNSLEFIGINN
jgi:hypothetical protein